jgi:glycerophosphoryl diester phosphodiesterase
MVSLPGTVRNTDSLINILKKTRVEILDGNYGQYTEDMVTTAGKTGHTVLPDIQGSNENPALWDIALQKGFKGLQTDHPEELIGYLEKRQLR